MLFCQAFLPRNKHLLISLLESPSAVILVPKKIKSVDVSIVFPPTCHEMMRLNVMILVFWMLSFKPAFSLLFHLYQDVLFFSFIFISWRLISLQYCSGFLPYIEWISHGFTCIPHPDPPSHLSLHLIPLSLPSAPAPSTCLMHPTWAGDFFHPWLYTCFSAVLSKHPTLIFSHRVQKSVLYICVSFSVSHIGLLLPSF